MTLSNAVQSQPTSQGQGNEKANAVRNILHGVWERNTNGNGLSKNDGRFQGWLAHGSTEIANVLVRGEAAPMYDHGLSPQHVEIPQEEQQSLNYTQMEDDHADARSPPGHDSPSHGKQLQLER